MQRIENLVTELRPILLEAGLKPSAIAYKKLRIVDATDKQRDDAVKWLEKFKVVNVGKYQEAKNLVPPMTRLMYKMSGIGNLETHEEKELKEAINWLKDEWRNRPIILRRDKDVSTSKTGSKSGKRNPKAAVAAKDTGKGV
jgi:hypothetical protein